MEIKKSGGVFRQFSASLKNDRMKLRITVRKKPFFVPTFEVMVDVYKEGTQQAVSLLAEGREKYVLKKINTTSIQNATYLVIRGALEETIRAERAARSDFIKRFFHFIYS